MSPGAILLYILVAAAILSIAIVGLVGRSRRRPAEQAAPEAGPYAGVATVEPLATPEPSPEPVPGPGQTVEAAVQAPEAPPDVRLPAPPVPEAPPVGPPGYEPRIPEAPAVAAAVPEAPAVKPTLRERLGRTRASFGQALAGVLRRGALSEQDWEEAEAVLLRSDVGLAATQRILDDLRPRAGGDLIAALRDELLAILGLEDRSLARKPGGLTVWLVTGVNGTGKTTTIGKLAHAAEAEGRRVLLAAADTFRAAADEQLEHWAERTGAGVVKHAPGADPAAVAFDGVRAARARAVDLLIIDTAGRLHTKRNLMEELAKIRRVLEREAGPPDEVLLVLDATTGQNGIAQARAFAASAGVTGIVLTKLDGTARGGIVIAVQQELGIPVKLIGVGEGPEDLAAFDPAAFVDALLS